MTFRDFVRLVCVVSACGSILSGCVASQGLPPPSPVTPTASKAFRTPVPASLKDLLYVSNASEVSIFDYESDTRVDTLSGFSRASGLCTDSHGDVFVTNYGAADILEFAHGGTKPIRTLIDPSPYPVDCSVDPTSGNLAVVNEYGQTEYSKGDVAIYAGARGNGKVYKDASLEALLSCTYDSRGDLLVSSYKGSILSFAMLATGSTQLKAVSLPFAKGSYGPPYVRWDGEYFVVEFRGQYTDNPSLFVMYTIKGTTGTEEGYLLTEGSGLGGGPFWLGTIGAPKGLHRANQLVAAINNADIVYWDYPEGGSYIYEIYGEEGAGVTVSTAAR